MRDKRLIVLAALLLLVGAVFLNRSNTISIRTVEDSSSATTTIGGGGNGSGSGSGGQSVLADYKGRSPFTAETCDNWDHRPFAVMLSGDSEARPIHGIGQADLMIEASVLTNGVTRYMGLYICEEPSVLGSLRSARHDFIPLVKGWDAIYGHWGGSVYALDILKTGVVDNINALADRFGAYYRDESLPEPHNGFSSYGRLERWAERANYRLSYDGGHYLHEVAAPTMKDRHDGSLGIGYPGKFKVIWNYDAARDFYLRRKGTQPEMDANTNTQVRAANVLVLKTTSYQLNEDYNSLDLKGSGDLMAYIHGSEIKGLWEKTDDDAPLRFLGADKRDLVLAPGKTWVEVVENGQGVVWESQGNPEPASATSTTPTTTPL